MDLHKALKPSHSDRAGREEGVKERKEEDRISEMSILHCEQRHLFMHSLSACVVVRRQAGVGTSTGRTEELNLRWL